MQPTQHQLQSTAAYTANIRASAARAVNPTDRFHLASWRRFGRHFLEMVLAMFAGMLVLSIAIALLGNPPGYDTLLGMYAYMALAMSAAMVAWMRRMGHPWVDVREMTAWMVVPMFALVLPVALGVEGYVPGLTADSLMLLAHVAMVGGMAALMFHRWDRYTGDAHCHAPSHRAV